MKVLIACEFSGVVRRAFRALGHDAWSCDFLPSEDESPFHIQSDVLDVIYNRFEDVVPTNAYRVRVKWDLMIAHPPCTYLSVSGARWFKKRQEEQRLALKFVAALASTNIPRWAIENPISILSSQWRKPDQIIQPWMFGHGETKATCLWLKNLPKLIPTDIVEGRETRVHRALPGPNRWKERSRTLTGIAKAMAQQWGSLV